MAYFGCINRSSNPPEPPELRNYLYKWNFKNSLFDTLNNTEFGIYGGATQNQNGITFSESNQYGKVLTPITMNNKTIELDVASFDASSQDTNISIIMNTNYNSPYYNTGALRWSNINQFWGCYLSEYKSSPKRKWTSWGNNLSRTFFSGKTIKITYEANNKLTLWIDNELIGTVQNDFTYHSIINDVYTENGLYIGGFSNSNADGNYFYNAIITGMRIYEPPLNLNWDLTDSLVDKNEGKSISLTGSGSAIIQDSNGLTISGGGSYATVPVPLSIYNVYEFDISNMAKDFDSSTHGRFIMPTTTEGFIWRYQTQQWAVYYKNRWYADDSGSTYVTDPNIFNGKTMKMLWDENNKLCVYADDNLIYRCSKTNALHGLSDTFAIGGSYGSGGYHDITITGIRVYTVLREEE